ncbi:MAG: Synerg-CTERM sorting domain-containing protein [bacterium]|nr:Synerg-CTERM sorting domain-containing protein [bacterium]
MFEVTPSIELSGLNSKLVSGDTITVTFSADDFIVGDDNNNTYTTTPPAPLTFTVVDAPHYTGSLEVIAHVPASASTDKLPGWTLISGDVETHYDSGQVVSFDFTDPSGSADVTVSPDFADELGGVSVLTPPSGPVTVSTQGRRTVHFFYNPKGSIFGAMTGPDNNAFDQGSFKVSGVTGTFKNGEGPEGLAEGSYEITYQDVDGYVTPQPKTVNVVRNVQGETNHFSANGTYTKTASGTLAVTIQPDKLAGARWYVDGNKEVTYESGKSVVLAPGSHTVSCTEVSGYQAPESQTVTVADGKTLEVTMKYTQPVGEMAKLLVNIKPAAVSADAQWTVDSATSKTAVWHKSGEEVELAVTVTGEYTITFKDVKGYKTPVPLTVKVEAGKTKTVDATYQPAGSGGSGGGCNAGVFPAALLLLAGLPLCLRKKK